MNNSATTRRITKIAIEYNGNDKGTAERVYQNNLLSQNPEQGKRQQANNRACLAEQGKWQTIN